MTSTTATSSRFISRSLTNRIATGLAVTAAAAALSFAGAGSASAQASASQTLAPGQGICTPGQYASYQVRLEASATGQGAKFKLLRNGVVIQNTPTRVSNWVTELRSSWGNFPGPAVYSACAQNTGTTNTIVLMALKTDSEF